MDKKQILFAKHLAEAICLMGKHFKLEKKSIWRWMKTPDPRLDNGKSPIEVLWQKGEKGVEKIKDFISSFQAGDYA